MEGVLWASELSLLSALGKPTDAAWQDDVRKSMDQV